MQSSMLPLSGIGFVALVVLSLVISGSTPESGESAAKVASFYDDNKARQLITSARASSATQFRLTRPRESREQSK